MIRGLKPTFWKRKENHIITNRKKFTRAMVLSSFTSTLFALFFLVILYAFIAVTVTNLCSLTGVICIPIKGWKCFKYVLNFMTGLAVSALFTTALLVLIPEVGILL